MTIVIPAWIISLLHTLGIIAVVFFAAIGVALLWCLKDAKWWI
jgi:hypothetical protein